MQKSDQEYYQEDSVKDKTQKASHKVAIQIKQIVVSKALWEQKEEHAPKVFLSHTIRINIHD